MDNPARAVADAPAKGARGVAGLLKNKPPAFYIVLVAGILAAAYLIRKREAAAQPADTTAQDVTPDSASGYAPVDGYYPSGGGGGGGIDTTGSYQGSNGPIPTQNGFLYDPATGMVYGALPDSQLVTPDPVPAVLPGAGTGGGMPATGSGGGGQVPTWTPTPAPAPTIPQGSSSVVLNQCGGKYPYSSERGCYRVVRIKSGTHKGKWHYYAPNDSPKIKVSSNPDA